MGTQVRNMTALMLLPLLVIFVPATSVQAALPPVALATPAIAGPVRSPVGGITGIGGPHLGNFPHTDAEAARFLTMATFGPTANSIARLRAIGYDAWFDEQLSAPVTLQRPQVEQLTGHLTNSGSYQDQRVEVWLATAVNAPDQLRQKLAWALSQIFVVSDTNSALNGQDLQLAEYQDMLARDAMADTSVPGNGPTPGTYERLLTDVTYSPAMSNMLSDLRNLPANPKTGTSPDENYAREVMQLFTIGLILRNPDFSPILSGGSPIPSYTQDTVSTNARIFTGLSYQNGFYTNPINNDGTYASAVYLPLSCYEAHHDETSKTLIDGATVPGGSNSCSTDAPAIIRALSRHPNTAPFIARQLIQRLTASNPSPAYIQRVSMVFADNGRAVHGDLAAVAKAILLDPEVHQLGGAASLGKAREPLLKLIAFWRYYGAAAPSGIYPLTHPEQAYAQAPLRSPSVFNFYSPDYLPQGEMSDYGLYGPEFQILNANTLVATANDLSSRAAAYVGNPANTPQTVAVNLSGLFALADSPTALVAQLNHDLLYGRMSPLMTSRLVTMELALANQPVATKVVSALQVVLASPEFAIQR